MEPVKYWKRNGEWVEMIEPVKSLTIVVSADSVYNPKGYRPGWYVLSKVQVGVYKPSSMYYGPYSEDALEAARRDILYRTNEMVVNTVSSNFPMNKG